MIGEFEMCNVGDIIVVSNYNDNGKNLSRHSFVVLSNEAGQIQGLEYDILCNVMSSFKSDEQRERKMRFPGNFPVAHTDSVIDGGNTKDGYIKAEQFYYFNKEKIDYIVIGNVKPETFNLLISFIEELDVEIKHIVDNL